MHGFEHERRTGAGGKVGDEINPDFLPGNQLHQADADRYRRIERRAGNGANRISTCQHGEANRQTIKRVAGSCFGGGNIQHNIRQSKRVQELDDERSDDVRIGRRIGQRAFDKITTPAASAAPTIRRSNKARRRQPGTRAEQAASVTAGL